MIRSVIEVLDLLAFSLRIHNSTLRLAHDGVSLTLGILLLVVLLELLIKVLLDVEFGLRIHWHYGFQFYIFLN